MSARGRAGCAVSAAPGTSRGEPVVLGHRGGPGAVGGRCPRTPPGPPALSRGPPAPSPDTGEKRRGRGGRSGRKSREERGHESRRERCCRPGPGPHGGGTLPPSQRCTGAHGSAAMPLAAGSPLIWCSWGGFHPEGWMDGDPRCSPPAHPVPAQRVLSTSAAGSGGQTGAIQHQHSLLGSSITNLLNPKIIDCLNHRLV